MRKMLQIPRQQMALLCIDLQEEQRQDARYTVAGFGTLLAHVVALQAQARQHGVAVLHACYVVDPDAPATGAILPVLQDGTPAFSAKGSPVTAICHEVQPLPGEPVFTKDRASVFSHPDFAAQLHARGIRWLLIVGVWTEACVDATVKDAILQGFHVLLVKDACGSGSVAMHQTGILNLANRLYGGAVATAATASALLSGAVAPVWMVEGSVPIRFDHDSIAAHYDAL